MSVVAVPHVCGGTVFFDHKCKKKSRGNNSQNYGDLLFSFLVFRVVNHKPPLMEISEEWETQKIYLRMDRPNALHE
jgi:hypothetical protein